MSDNLKVAIGTVAAIVLAFGFVYLTSSPRLECGAWKQMANGLQVRSCLPAP